MNSDEPLLKATHELAINLAADNIVIKMLCLSLIGTHPHPEALFQSFSQNMAGADTFAVSHGTDASFEQMSDKSYGYVLEAIQRRRAALKGD